MTTSGHARPVVRHVRTRHSAARCVPGSWFRRRVDSRPCIRLRSTCRAERRVLGSATTPMNLDTVYGNDVVGDLADARTKTHHDVCVGLVFDQHPAVEADRVVHECLPSPPDTCGHPLALLRATGELLVPVRLTGTVTRSCRSWARSVTRVDPMWVVLPEFGPGVSTSAHRGRVSTRQRSGITAPGGSCIPQRSSSRAHDHRGRRRRHCGGMALPRQLHDRQSVLAGRSTRAHRPGARRHL